ncbi:MAG: Na+-transporting NADH:ubiquinone oxidoreductase subunit D [Clostridiales bacterium]|nr:MAG: Na+-transporting NADH:ubiquinone oxidoreductase subunit D [Clostridiales bacterium]
MERKLIVTSSPHIRSKEATDKTMRDVVIALVPATLAGMYYFGFQTLIVVLLAVAAAMATEAIIQNIRKQPITVMDYSAAVTGLLLALNLPPEVTFWMPVVGSIFAIAIAKQAFGGLGHNFINPALAARVFLIASWPVEMTTWKFPVDAVTEATPLALIKGSRIVPESVSIFNMFIGKIGGCIGEVSALALLIGGIYLVYRGVISPRIPVAYMGTVAVLTLLYGGFNFNYMMFHLLAGGLVLGAIFMATDYVSSPMTAKGQIIYAVGCGLITVVIRLFGGYPGGVSFSILFMNVVTPLIDKYVKSNVFGGVKK